MPETSALEVRRIRVSRQMLMFGLGAIALVLVGLLGAFAHSVFLWDEARENVSLHAENAALKERLEDLDRRLASVGQVVDRLQEFDSKLRSLALVSDPDRSLAMGPVGEPIDEPREELEGTSQLRKDLMSAGDFTRGLGLVESRLTRAEVSAYELAGSLQKLSVHLEGQRSMLAAVPSRRPTRGYVSSTFGMRIDPFTGLPQMHAGIDFSAAVGAKVVSTADGTVIYSGRQGGYGNLIKVEHREGLVTQYAHLSKRYVKVGEAVKRGQLIGAVGNTGRSTGPHLHYEVRLNGIPQDPRRFLLE